MQGDIRCPDCNKLTYPGASCEYCGCPLTPEAAMELLETLKEILAKEDEESK